MDLSGNNIFLYWVGKEYRLITLLRKLIYLHAKHGEGYTVHLITRENIGSYIHDLPACFDALCPAHQADVVRVNVVCKYGGIWMDSDVLVLEPLDTLFKHIHEKNGFFMLEDTSVYNGLFGSKANTELMRTWKTTMDQTLARKREHIGWTEIGNSILTRLRATHPRMYGNYEIYNGNATMIPSHWSRCVGELIHAPRESYVRYETAFQPVLVLYNAIYKTVETIENYRSLPIPLNYFIDKSIANLGKLAEGAEL